MTERNPAGPNPRTESEASRAESVIATDGGTDLPETVYRTSSAANPGMLHVEADCDGLDRAKTVREKDLSVFPPAHRTWCPQCAGHLQDRTPDREELRADGGVASGCPGKGESVAGGLTAFQWDILAALKRSGPSKGVAIKADLEARYGVEVNHGRLYPNLDDLVQQGLVSKSQRDRRTNEYRLTDRGDRELRARRAWLGDQQAAADGGERL